MEAAIATMREEEIAGPGIPRNRMATRDEIERVREAARVSTSYVDLVAIIDVLSRMPLRMERIAQADRRGPGDRGQRRPCCGRKHPNRRIKERIVEVVPLIICPMTGVNTYELVASRVPANAEANFRPFDFAGQDVSNAWIAACKRAGVDGPHVAIRPAGLQHHQPVGRRHRQHHRRQAVGPQEPQDDGGALIPARTVQ